MTHRRLKRPVLYAIYGLSFVALLSIIFLIESLSPTPTLSPENNLDYVTKTVFENSIPVVNEEKVIIKPYIDENIKVIKSFYGLNDSNEQQENSIIYYEGTYLPNSGIVYGNNTEFDVVSIYDGEVIEVKSDNILGTIVEISHENNIISIYQSLSNVTVKTGDKVNQGQIIGKSGLSNIEKDLGSHLHFELIVNGLVVNPEDYYNKKLSEL